MLRLHALRFLSSWTNRPRTLPSGMPGGERLFLLLTMRLPSTKNGRNPIMTGTLLTKRPISWEISTEKFATGRPNLGPRARTTDSWSRNCELTLPPTQYKLTYQNAFSVSFSFTKLGMGAAQNGDKKSFHITFRYGLSDPNTDCQYSYSSKTECVEGPRCDWKAQVCVGSKAENGKFETLLKPDLYDNSCLLDTLGPDAWTAFVNGTAA